MIDLEENKQDSDKKDKKKLIIIILIIILILLLLGGGAIGLVYGAKNGNARKARERDNLCTLARTYADRGEYDRALNRLDEYLEKNGDDEGIWDLWNEILDMKKAADAEKNNEAATIVNNYTTQPGNFTIDVDTSEISSAMQDSISSMKDALAQTNKQAEDNRRAM